ncbi:MAG: hypothetical protein AAGA17_17580 [Actinomycetota bacterium]
MARRFPVVLLLAVLLLVGPAASTTAASTAMTIATTTATTVATTTATSAPTTLPELPDGVNSIIGPNPGQVTGPVDPDDRGGTNQLLVLGVMVLAIGGIGLLITRDVRRARSRRSDA